MRKKFAMSAMGYGIVSVIVLGIIMIISAPMIVNNSKREKTQTPNENIENIDPQPPANTSNNFDYSELQNLEERLNARIDSLETRQNSQPAPSSSNNYLCTMEGALDASGEVIPLESPNRTDKIVFVCQYNQ